jgi:hypothetical protein
MWIFFSTLKLSFVLLTLDFLWNFHKDSYNAHELSVQDMIKICLICVLEKRMNIYLKVKDHNFEYSINFPSEEVAEALELIKKYDVKNISDVEILNALQGFL